MSVEQKEREEHSQELLDRWNTIITQCEKEIADKIEIANEKSLQKVILPKQRRDEIFRDDLWKEYKQRRTSLLCSRCGEYKSYSIMQSEHSLVGDIHRFDLYSGSIRPYKIDYTLKSELVTNPNSLADEPFYDICKRCQAHLTGKKPYPLSSNYEEITRELNNLHKIEQKRRYKQEDDMNEIRAEILKKKKAEIENDEEDGTDDTPPSDTNSKKKNEPSIRHRIGNILQGGSKK